MARFAILIAGFVALASCQSAPGPQRDHSQPAALTAEAMGPRVDTALSGLVEREELAGISALVWVDGQEVYYGAYGMADIEADRPMQRDALAHLYSMTKPITGVTLMTLYEKGLFSLDDPLSKYFPEFADIKVYGGVDEDGNPILNDPERQPLVIDIMRHTAGLTNGDNDGTIVGDKSAAANPMALENNLQEMVAKLATVPLLYQPRERWLYGPSVDVQAALVERLSGKPFDEYMREAVLDPLGMSDTGYLVPEEDRDRLAQVYIVEEPGVFVPENPEENGMRLPLADYPMKPGGYGLVSTLDDYMRFARMLVNKGELDGVRILKPETVALMSTNHMPDTVGDKSWLPSKGQVGFGIDFAVRIAPPVNEEEKFGVPGEFFWDGRASTLFWVDPANDLTAVMFVQFLPFDVAPAHKQFRDAVYGVREYSPQ